MTGLTLVVALPKSSSRPFDPRSLFRKGEDGSLLEMTQVEFDPKMLFKTAGDGCLLEME